MEKLHRVAGWISAGKIGCGEDTVHEKVQNHLRFVSENELSEQESIPPVRFSWKLEGITRIPKIRAYEVELWCLSSTSLCYAILFPNAAKLNPQNLVQDALAENGNNGNSKVKQPQKTIKSAVKHIYSKIDAPLKTALLKLKQKYPSLSFRKRKTRSKRNGNVDNGHAKKNKRSKRNGPNVTLKRC